MFHLRNPSTTRKMDAGSICLIHVHCVGIRRCGGCGDGEGAAPRGPMVDGVKRERLHEGRRLQTMGGSVGGRRVQPRRAGAEIIMECERCPVAPLALPSFT